MISPQAPDIKICASRDELAKTVANLVNLRIRQGLEATEVFHLALTGGSLGILIAELLVSQWNEKVENFAG